MVPPTGSPPWYLYLSRVPSAPPPLAASLMDGTHWAPGKSDSGLGRGLALLVLPFLVQGAVGE